MAASYPGAVKTFTTKAAGGAILAAHINDLQDEVKAVETQLVTSKLATFAGAWVAWSPTQTGWSYLPTGVYRYFKIGNLVTCMVATINGPSSDTVATLSLPFTAATITNASWSGTNGYAVDNNVTLTVATRWRIKSGATSVEFFTDMGTGGWTASNAKNVQAVFTYEAA